MQAVMRVTPVPARFLVTVGLVLVTVGAALGVVYRTVTDRAALVARSDQILEQDSIRNTLAQRLADTLTPPNPYRPADEIDDENPSLPLARRAIVEPVFTRAFTGAVAAVHDHVVRGEDAPLALDPLLVGQAVAAARGADTGPPVALTLPDDRFPDVRGTVTRVGRGAVLLLVAGAGVLAAGVIASKRRARVAMRIGRWAIVTGLVAVVWCWAVPQLLLEPMGGWTAVLGIVIGIGEVLVVPALLTTLGGIALVLGAHAWEVRDRRRALAHIPRHQGREAGWVPPA